MTVWTTNGNLCLGRTVSGNDGSADLQLTGLRMTSSNPDETLRAMSPPPLDEVRVVGGIDYETGVIDISYVPIEDAITKLARLADPDAGNELVVNPPRRDDG